MATALTSTSNISTSTPTGSTRKRPIWAVNLSPESLGPLLARPGGREWLIKELTALQAARKLKEFVRQAWQVIEPETPFTDGWVIDAMCDHLEAVIRGQIRDLIINIPPRHMKSLLTSVFMPVWRWLERPGEQFLFSSYGDSLSTRDSVKSRRLIKSAWFQDRWGCPYPKHDVPGFSEQECPARFHLSNDQDAKHYYTNDRGGHRFSTSVDAATTGFGGDVLVLDDPHNVQEAESETVRESTLRYVNQSWATRGNNPKTVRKIVIMQRVHVGDATADLLKQGGWVHLCLPAEHSLKGYSYAKTAKPAPNPLGYVDPRTTEGELLWPQRMGPPEIMKAKLIGARAYAGQFMQQPTAAGGDMFNVVKLRERTVARLSDIPMWHATMQVYWARGWDLASTTKKTSKRTAGVRLGVDELGRFIIGHVKLGKWRPDERNDEMIQTMTLDRHIHQYIEHEGGSSGEDQELTLVRTFAGQAVEFVKVTGDKAVRADAWAAQVNHGNVWILDDGTWDVEEFLAELQSFPNGDYLDQVDGGSLVFNKIHMMRPAPLEVGDPRQRQPVTVESEVVRQQAAAGLDTGDWQQKLESM
jgi:predicted phage terminase large subunit-like protein